MQFNKSNIKPIIAICVASILAYILVFSGNNPDEVVVVGRPRTKTPPTTIDIDDGHVPAATRTPRAPSTEAPPPPPPPSPPKEEEHHDPVPAPDSHINTTPLTRPIGNDNCPQIRTLAKSLFNLPNDIQLLLGILRAYIDDSATVIELGSRQGSSTCMILDSAPKRFATVDLFVTPTVAAMHKYGRECTKSSADEYFTVQGDDLVVPIPFEHEVDTMFLDTLHASWLLEQELVRYPSHVKHYMAFHDTFSFMNIDEVYPTVTERRNEKTQTWRGLKVVFDDFLRTHKDEWVEDMSYIHNNGLYVLRRKSFVPTLPQITSSSGQYDFENSVQSDLGANLMSEEQCRQLIGAIGSPDSKICDQVYVFYRRTALTDSYTRLSMGSHPLARQLPVIFGYTIAVNSFRVMDCVTPVLIAALHGAKSNDRTMYVASSLTPENCPALQYLRERVPQEYQSIQFSDSVKVDLVISKAGTSESFEGRVYTLEYGTSVLASHLTANDAFELHSVLQQKPGIAVWKKKGAMDYNYIQL